MKRRKINIIEKIEGDFKIKLLICVILSSIVLLGYLIVNSRINAHKFYEYTITEDINFMNEIENASIEEDNLVVTGYAFLVNEDSRDSSISVFLRNTGIGKDIWLKIQQSARPDVNRYYDSDYNYENSGFSAKTKVNNKFRTNDCYEIILNIDYKDNEGNKIRKTVSSNYYLLNGKIYTYNPKEFDEPDMNVESELLREVFSSGRLCFYMKTEGMYVYQYEGRIYWIATQNFAFDKSGHTYIPYHAYTTQINKIPAERIPNKFINLDFIFEQQEFMGENTAPYRVVYQDIPKDYSVTYINTGLYDGVNNIWKWIKFFPLDNAISAQ